MKLRVLGCGTSAGVPRIGNDWGRCDPGEPRNRRSRCSLLVESGDKRLLVDCGPDVREQLLSADVGDLNAVIVTHAHADHCHGIDELRPIAQRLKRAIPLYGKAGLLEALQHRFAYAFSSSDFYMPLVEPRVIEGLDKFGDASLRVVDQPHGGVTSLGLRFDEGDRSAIYAIDFHAMTDAMAKLYEGAEVMICDCLQRRPHPTHAYLDAVIGWARELKIGQVYLTHMNNSMDYRTLLNELPDWVAPAYDGLEIEL